MDLLGTSIRFLWHISLKKSLTAEVNLYQTPKIFIKAVNHNKLYYKITETKPSDKDIKKAIRIETL